MASVSYLSSTNPYVMQQDVANQLAMDKMMVSDVVKTLVGKGLMLRQPHPDDKRAMSLQLSTAAKNLLKKAVPLVEETDENFFGRLKPDQLKHFKECLAQLLITHKF